MAAQTQSVGVYDDSSGTILTAAAFVATAGRLLVAKVTHEGTPSTISCTDTALNTYQGRTQANHSNGDMTARILDAKNCNGSAVNVVVGTIAAARPYRGMTVRELSGCDTSSPFDTEISAESSTAGTITSGSMTAAGAGVIVCCGKAYNDDVWTLGTNFTDLLQGGTPYDLHGSEIRVIGSGGSYTASITRGGSTDVLLVAAIYKDAGAGGPVIPAFRRSLLGAGM
jgi:hypothetical protein